jgi:hypothetical protein
MHPACMLTQLCLQATGGREAGRQAAGRQAGHWQLASIARLDSGKAWHDLRQASCK